MKSTDLKFYTSYFCPYCKPVEYLLKTSKIPNEHIIIDLLSSEQATEEYRKINPQQTVPAIVEGDFVLYESNTLMKYICNSREVDDHWYPKDPKKRALVDLYIDFHLQNVWDLVRYSYTKIGMTGSTLDEAKKISDNAFKELESIFLSKRKFLVSDDKITICDLALLWQLSGLVEAGYEFSKTVKAYYDNVINTDSVELGDSIAKFLEERKKAMEKRQENK